MWMDGWMHTLSGRVGQYLGWVNKWQRPILDELNLVLNSVIL